ncbi:MAG: hypothetical protein WCJ84_01590 [Candidatus Peregrinibacteria bacterium]
MKKFLLLSLLTVGVLASSASASAGGYYPTAPGAYYDCSLIKDDAVQMQACYEAQDLQNKKTQIKAILENAQSYKDQATELRATTQELLNLSVELKDLSKKERKTVERNVKILDLYIARIMKMSDAVKTKYTAMDPKTELSIPDYYTVNQPLQNLWYKIDSLNSTIESTILNPEDRSPVPTPYSGE